MPASAAASTSASAHGVRVGVAAAAGRVVQVVELADAGDAGERHLGVDGGGQRAVAVRVERARRRAYIPRARSRTCRRRAWVRPRRARWKACECALAKPGSDEAGQAVAVRRGASASTTAAIRPSTTVDAHRRRPGRRGSHACSHQKRRHRGAGRSSTAASATTPAAQSAGSACSVGRVARPRSGCGRTASRSARWRRGCRRRGPRRSASTGTPPSATGAAGRRSAGVEVRPVAVTDSSRDVDGAALARRRPLGACGDLARPGAGAASSAPRASSQASHAGRRSTLVPPGTTRSRPTVARAPSPLGRRARAASTVGAAGSIGSRRSASGVVPAWLASPVNVEAATGRAARSRCRRRRGAAGRRARGPARRAARRTRRCRRSASASRPEPRRVGPAARQRLGERTPSGSRSAARAVGVERRRSAAASPGTARRTGRPPPRRRPTTRERPRGVNAAGPQHVDGGERRTPRRAGRRRRRRRARSRGGCR